MRRAVIQAGLFGAGMAVLLNFIALLPYVGACIALPLYPVAFFLTGLVMVRVVDFVPGVSEATVDGAIAGLIAGLVGGLVAMFLAPIRLALAGGPEQAVLGMPPALVQRLVEQGLDPVAVADFLGTAGLGVLFCAAQVITAMLLAAGAAALYAAYRQT